MDNRFGNLLREYRERRIDADGCLPESGGRLTQARLGELVGRKLELHAGLSGAAVSAWERGESKISAQDRRLLIALVEVLHETCRLTTPADADALLLAGGYSPLSTDERQSIFPNMHHRSDLPEDSAQPSEIVIRPGEAWRRWRERFFSGPVSGWPERWWDETGKLLMGRPSRFWFQAAGWSAVWVAAWQSLFPLMHWPFADGHQAARAAALYAGASLVIPAVVTVLAAPWQAVAPRASDVRPARVLLLGWLGAAIGFQVGSLLLFLAALVGYHLSIGQVPPLLEFASLGLPFSLGTWAAHRVPADMWKAHGRLALSDAGIFFVCPLAGPLWSGLILEWAPLLLDPGWGLWIPIGAGVSAAGLAYAQQRLTGSSLIPVHWWIAIYGLMAVLHSLKSGADYFTALLLAGLTVTLYALAAWGRLYLTLPGTVGFLIGVLIVWGISELNRELGLAAVFLGGLVWWRWGKAWISFPAGFWIVVLAAAASTTLRARAAWTATEALTLYGIAVLIVLFWEWRRTGRPPSGKSTP